MHDVFERWASSSAFRRKLRFSDHLEAFLLIPRIKISSPIRLEDFEKLATFLESYFFYLVNQSTPKPQLLKIRINSKRSKPTAILALHLFGTLLKTPSNYASQFLIFSSPCYEYLTISIGFIHSRI